MDLSDKNELKTAVEKISNLLSIDIGNIDKELEALSINSNELLYDKIDSEKNSSPLFRYLLVCRSYIKQPSLELKYDIFQAAIVIPYIRNLSSAIDKLLSDVKNSRARIESLIYKKTVDELNSTIVELLTAYRYSLNENVKSVEFIEENSTLKTPDIKIIESNDRLAYFECKKIDHQSDISINVRKVFVEKCAPIKKLFRNNFLNGIYEIYIKCDPKDLNEELLVDSFKKCNLYNVGINTEQFDLRKSTYKPIACSDYSLNPSPKFYKERFDWNNDSEWEGFIFSFEGTTAGPSWVDTVNRQLVIKWKIIDDNIMQKQLRLPFNRIYKGLSQLEKLEGNTILHVFFERDIFIDNRQDILLDFYRRLEENNRDIFSYILFNELYFNVDIDGYFVFEEHTHPISGPLVTDLREPLQTLVFEHDEDQLQKGEFGIGYKY